MYEFTPVDWNVRKLGDFATIVNKRFSKKINAPILSMTKYRGFVKSLEYFNKQVFSNDISNYRLVEKDNFAYATIHLDEGSIGLLKDFKNGYISPMYTVFQVDSTVDNNYLILLMKTKTYLYKYEALGAGTVDRRKSVKFSELAKLKIPLPSLPEQQKIASILSNIDNLITNTQKIIYQTKSLKQGLMHKLLTSGIDHKKFKKVKWLFGKEIEIPQEWEKVRLKEVSVDGLKNGIFKKREDFGMGVPLVNVSDLFSKDVIETQNLDKVQVTKQELVQFGLNEGDIFFCRSSLAMKGIGQSNIVLKLDESSVFECHIMMLRPNQMIIPKFLFYFTRSFLFRQIITSIAMTLTMTTIRQPDLETIFILFPKIEEQQKITSILSNIDSKIQSQTQYKEKLERLKKSLMQKLLTGEVRVTV